jgi:hypothetical protein
MLETLPQWVVGCVGPAIASFAAPQYWYNSPLGCFNRLRDLCAMAAHVPDRMASIQGAVSLPPAARSSCISDLIPGDLSRIAFTPILAATQAGRAYGIDFALQAVWLLSATVLECHRLLGPGRCVRVSYYGNGCLRPEASSRQKLLIANGIMGVQ